MVPGSERLGLQDLQMRRRLDPVHQGEQRQRSQQATEVGDLPGEVVALLRQAHVGEQKALGGVEDAVDESVFEAAMQE